MPRKKLVNRIKRIIIEIDDKCVVFELNKNEKLEIPKNIRKQMMKSIKNKINKKCIKNDGIMLASINQQNYIQKPSFQIDNNINKNENILMTQNQTKNEKKESIFDLIASNSSQLINDDEWMNIFY